MNGNAIPLFVLAKVAYHIIVRPDISGNALPLFYLVKVTYHNLIRFDSSGKVIRSLAFS
jgi:hypothetical protein